MRRTTSYIVLFCVLSCSLAIQPCAGQTGNYRHHAWARFGTGSWKKVRVLTETLDEEGQVKTSTVEETKTTLTQVDDGRYTIRVETIVEVAGKRLLAVPKYITRGFNGEVNDQKALIRRLGHGEVAICGRRYRSEVKQIVINGSDSKLVSKVHYSPDVTPHVLQRETTGTSGNVNSFESLVKVVALDMATDVLGESKLSSHVKTVHKLANGEKTITLEVQCVDVPGAVVSHTEQTFSAKERLVQRRKLELMGYEARVRQVPHQVYRVPRRLPRRGRFKPQR